jgi:hypothetical protein
MQGIATREEQVQRPDRVALAHLASCESVGSGVLDQCTRDPADVLASIRDREFSFAARPVFRCFFPADTLLLCDQMMEYRLADGTVGYGLYENGYLLLWDPGRKYLPKPAGANAALPPRQRHPSRTSDMPACNRRIRDFSHFAHAGPVEGSAG